MTQPAAAARRNYSTPAILALAFALAAWVFSFGPLALLAIGCGIAGRRDVARNGKDGRALAIAGLVIAGLYALVIVVGAFANA